jgi:O-antigen/teichoic acid export membrane protein
LFIGTLVGQAFEFLVRTLMARFLGADRFGLLSLGWGVVVTISIFARLGMGRALPRFISFYREEPAKVKGTIVSGLTIMTPLTLILTAAVFLTARPVAVALFQKPDLEPVLRVLSIAVFFYTFVNVMLNATLGFEDAKYAAIVRNIQKALILLIFLALFALRGNELLVAANAYNAGIAISCALAAYFLWGFYRQVDSSEAAPMSRELLAFSLPLAIYPFFDTGVEWGESFVLGRYGSSADVGIYTTAMLVVTGFRQIQRSFIEIYIPVCSGMLGRENILGLKQLYQVVTKWVSSLAWPLAILLIVFAKPILSAVFGAQFDAGSSALQILILGFLTSAVTGPAGVTILAAGRTRWNLLSRGMTALINVSLSFWLVPQNGIVGAALATSAAIGVVSLLELAAAYHFVKVHPFDWRRLRPVLLSTLILFAASVGIRLSVEMMGLVPLVIVTGSLLILYALTFWISGGIQDEEQRVWLALKRRVKEMVAR